MKVTACLITWKRQHNIPEIVENLLKYDFISEIIIRDNSKTENIINYGRYDSAKRATNDIIYTQDDDYILKNINELYELFLKDPSRIAHAGPDYYLKNLHNNIWGDNQMSLMGWGSFFDRRWIDKNLDPYIKKYGKDYCFYRETDRIFSIMHGKHSNFMIGNLIQFPEADDDNALCQQEDHIPYKELAISRARELYESQKK